MSTIFTTVEIEAARADRAEAQADRLLEENLELTLKLQEVKELLALAEDDLKKSEGDLRQAEELIDVYEDRHRLQLGLYMTPRHAKRIVAEGRARIGADGAPIALHFGVNYNGDWDYQVGASGELVDYRLKFSIPVSESTTYKDLLLDIRTRLGYLAYA